jgi:hypothetical protein
MKSTLYKKSYQHHASPLKLIAVLIGLMMIGFGCSQTSFSPVNKGEAAQGGSGGTPVPPDPDHPVDDGPTASQEHHTKFEIISKKPPVDILFVVDNSISMEDEQKKISQEFSRFISQISNVDWRIAITTTDNESTGAGSKGSFLNFAGSSGKLFFVDAKTPNVNSLFVKTIKTGTAGSLIETGMYSIREFIKHSNNSKKVESTFLRKDADFHTIVVSDSDQAEYTENAFASKDLVKLVQAKVKSKYVNHSFVDDKTGNCDSEVVGSSYIALSKLTKGTVSSICKPNYADSFKLVAQNINSEVGTKVLDCVPLDTDEDGKPDLVILSPTGEVLLDYKLDGVAVSFNRPLTQVGSYEMKYQCPVERK